MPIPGANVGGESELPQQLVDFTQVMVLIHALVLRVHWIRGGTSCFDAFESLTGQLEVAAVGGTTHNCHWNA
jgi:hypothetical protein